MVKERIYEIGIFLSIGTSKIQIIMQFIFELIFISIPSIISSLFLGNVLLKVIVDGFINSEDSMISGGSLINNSSFMSKYNNAWTKLFNINKYYCFISCICFFINVNQEA